MTRPSDIADIVRYAKWQRSPDVFSWGSGAPGGNAKDATCFGASYILAAKNWRLLQFAAAVHHSLPRAHYPTRCGDASILVAGFTTTNLSGNSLAPTDTNR